MRLPSGSKGSVEGLATDRGAGRDLRTYVSENGPLPPHRAALLVAGLAEQLALTHAEGSAYGGIGPETVHVAAPGPRVVSVSAPVIPLSEAAASDNVRDASALLAWLLGSTPEAGRPESAPAALWRVVQSGTGADAARRPSAALLARLLRDVARDLLLDVTPPAGAAPAVPPAPRYLPDAGAALGPHRGRRPRWTGRALLVGATSVLAIALAAAGILLPAARVHLPLANGGLVDAASRGLAHVSPTGTAAATRATAGEAGAGLGPGPASDPPGPPTGSPADATSQPPPDASGSTDATPSPPPPAAPPAGEPTPQPGTTYETSRFNVPSGASRPPLVRGELIWYARSVGVSAVIASTSPCAAAVFTGYSGSTQVSHIATAYRCGSVTVSQNLNGRTTSLGITQVVVDLYVNGTRIGRDNCLRQTGACTRA